MANPIIETHKLTRRFKVADKGPGIAGALRHLVRPRFREVVALDALDLAIEDGESVAYAGPNGAGKSTTLKMCAGILVPSSGNVRVCGLIPHRNRTAHATNIGVVFGQRPLLWWDLPVRDSLRLLGDIYRVPGATYARNFRELVAEFELEPLLGVPARQLSLGQRMRCDVAAALLHSPRVLFLDEPTIGLDIEIKARVRLALRRRHRAGVTIVLTSHDLDDVELLCDRLVLIDKGRVMLDAPFSTLRANHGRSSIRIALKEAVPDTEARLTATFAQHPGAIAIDRVGAVDVVLSFDSNAVTAGELTAQLFQLLPVHDVRVEDESLESILLRLYREQPRRTEAPS